MSGKKDCRVSFTSARQQDDRRAIEQIQKQRALEHAARMKQLADAAHREAERQRLAREESARKEAQRQQALREEKARVEEQRRRMKQESTRQSAAKVRFAQARLQAEQAYSSLLELCGDDSGIWYDTDFRLRITELADSDPTKDDSTEIANGISNELTQAIIQARTEACQLDQQMAELNTWATALAQEETVNDFQKSECEQWLADIARYRDAYSAKLSLMEARRRVDELLGKAKSIFEEAGVRQGNAKTRDRLLQDIKATLAEMGFFVSERLATPGDRSAAVIITAKSGSKNVTAQVDLTSHVHSHWDGLAEDHCRSSFLDYMKRMERKGVLITPDRSDLRDLPDETQMLEEPAKEASEKEV